MHKGGSKNILFFISISFPVKLQAWAFWWFASGPPKDKICVFMNYLFYNFTPSPSMCLENCLFHPSSLFVYHLNSLESWIWAIEDTIQYVFDSKLWVHSIRVLISHNRWRFCLLILKPRNPRFQRADPSDQTWYRFRGLNNIIHTSACTVIFNFAQLYYALCRPCSGMAEEKAPWARSTYRLPTSRQVSRSSVRPPTRQSPTARRPVSRLTSSVSIPLLSVSLSYSLWLSVSLLPLTL